MARVPVTLQLFIRSSRVQRRRAMLTIAAIAWGALSLLLLLAFGQGLSQQMKIAGMGLGRDIAIFWPGETTQPWKGLDAGRPIRPRIADLQLLRRRMPDAGGVSGEIRNLRVALTWGNKTNNVQVFGVSLVYGRIRNHIAAAGGRFLDPIDDAQRRRVIFLGDELATDVFADVDPVGKTLLVDNVPYTVIGVMKHKMQTGSYGTQDKNHAVIPLRTFEAQYGRDRLSNIVLDARQPRDMPELIAELRRTLSQKYGFDPEDERAMPVWNHVKDREMTRNILFGIEIFLGVIGALTLAVGGIGVANIMYAVVKERTREIGVKMALGARGRWITGPLILEGMIYTLLGGVLGVAMATTVVMLLGMVPTEGNEALELLGKPTLSPSIGVVAALVLGIIGLLAAYFPARRAARVQPAETLRYE
jgi:putative ABC transport system permease protein